MTRKIIFGTYDTLLHGPWTLASWSLTPAPLRQQLVTVPGRDGDLDLSTALTDGVPSYGSRILSATFERSDGTRLSREDAINTMINWLDGWRMDIRVPDDELHYLTGRVSVTRNYNDPAHASVTVTATCDPWRFNNHETVVARTVTTAEQTVRLTNSGRLAVIPVVQITGDAAMVLLVHGSYSWALGPGSYQLPDIVVPQGGLDILCSGTGSISFTYREAVL